MKDRINTNLPSSETKQEQELTTTNNNNTHAGQISKNAAANTFNKRPSEHNQEEEASARNNELKIQDVNSSHLTTSSRVFFCSNP